MPTTDSMRQSYSEYVDLHELAYWAVLEGACIDDRVSLSRQQELGAFAYANTNIPPGTRLLSIPRELAIDYAKAASRLPGVIVGDPNLTRKDVTHLFFALEKLKQNRSLWWPYIKTLPSIKEGYGGPLVLPVEEAEEWLSGTNLAGECRRLLAEYRETHQKILGAMKRVEGWERNAHQFTFELYLWVLTIFSSRAFPDKLLCGPMMGETYGVQTTEADSSTPALFPLLDILNHRPRNKICWNPDLYGLAFVNEVPLPQSQMIWNNYGPKTNEQLLLSYGFVFANNPNDSVRLKMPQFLTGDRLQAWRMLVSSDRDKGVYEFYAEDPSTPRLLWQYLQILFANEQELEILKQDPCIDHWVSQKNALMSKAHLWNALVVKNTQHRNGGEGLIPRNGIHRAMQAYRAHQVRILTAAANKLAEQVTEIIRKPEVMTLEKLRNDDELEEHLLQILGEEEEWDDDSPFVLGLCRKYMQYKDLTLRSQLGENTWLSWFHRMGIKYPMQETPISPGSWAQSFYDEYIAEGDAPGIFGSPTLTLSLLQWMEWVYGEESFLVPWGKPVSCIFLEQEVSIQLFYCTAEPLLASII